MRFFISEAKIPGVKVKKTAAANKSFIAIREKSVFSYILTYHKSKVMLACKRQPHR